MPRIYLAAFAVAMLAAVAAPASALYIQTPLILSGPEHADVGDDVSFDIRPENASAKQEFAGKTVRIIYLFDPSESNDPDAPVSSDGMQERFLKEIGLDGKATATFTWTVPEEVRDHNVDLVVLAGDERVAFAFLAIGDAPPQMRIASASGPGEPEPHLENADGVSEDAAGLGVLAGIAAVGGVLALRRK